jgi:uncharacterized protein DUF5666
MQIGRTLSYAGTAAALTSAGILSLGGGAGAQPKTHGSNSLSGVVTSVSSNGFEVLLPDTSREEILTTTGTEYTESGSPDPVKGVAIGENVEVRLAPSTTSAASPTASRVEILLDAVRGKVVKVTDSSITIAHGPSGVRTVQVTSSTKYYDDGTAASGVTDGERVTAYGTPSDGSGSGITAWYVDVRGGSSMAPSPVSVPAQQPAPPGPTGPTTTTVTGPSVIPPTTLPVGPSGQNPGPNPQGFDPGGPMQPEHARFGSRHGR